VWVVDLDSLNGYINNQLVQSFTPLNSGDRSSTANPKSGFLDLARDQFNRGRIRISVSTSPPASGSDDTPTTEETAAQSHVENPKPFVWSKVRLVSGWAKGVQCSRVMLCCCGFGPSGVECVYDGRGLTHQSNVASRSDTVSTLPIV
jgi:hypothetical protein